MLDDADNPAGEDLRRWLGEVETTVTATAGEARERRNRLLRRGAVVAAIVMPWALVAVVGTGSQRHGTADRPHGPSSVATPSDGATQRTTRAAIDAGEAPGTGEDRAGAAHATQGAADPARTAPSRSGGPGDAAGNAVPVPGAVGPTAVGIVRDAVTRAGDRTSALDSASAEPPQPLSRGAWIVRVHAVVLRGDRRRWRTARHEIWAVPVGRRGAAVVGLDRPWRVSTAPARIAATGWQPTAIDAEPARAALQAVGIDVGRVRAQRHPDLTAIVRVRAGPRWVWLRTAPDVAVLGALSDGGPPAAP